MNPMYEQLSQVKIIKNVKPKSTSGWSIFITMDYPEEENLITWTAIYNTKYDLYIVTDDIHISGLNDRPDLIRLIGYSDNIDWVMFMIYEHQVSIGSKYTIMDEIKSMNKNKEIILSDDNEWKWKQDISLSQKIHQLNNNNKIQVDFAKLMSIHLDGIDMNKIDKDDDTDAKN